MYPISEADWNRYRSEVLDHHLNVAVLLVTRRLFPASFDVSESAPDTYEKLVALFESSKRYVVYSGGSEQTIFGDPDVNYHFRAWHDWCHWRGGYDFSMQGEYNTLKLQCQHLTQIYGNNAQTRRWRRILFAEVIGQKIFQQLNGHFPENQRRFVDDYLERGVFVFKATRMAEAA